VRLLAPVGVLVLGAMLESRRFIAKSSAAWNDPGSETSGQGGFIVEIKIETYLPLTKRSMDGIQSSIDFFS
jgi:hypothetical protein